MNKPIYLTLSGISMLAAGITLLLSTSIGVGTSKILVPLFLLVSGIMAFIFSQVNGQHKVAKTFHFLQGAGLMTFAILIAIWPDTLDMFLKMATYFIMVYGLFEIMFAFSVLRSSFKVDKSILMTRLMVGAINFIGSFVLFMSLLKSTSSGLSVAGFLIVLGGLGFIIFANRIKKID
ncbi:hypothetical protein [Flagellimonas myxillae]|uniref:hypothetical protein n=1 Tax=Flagellimonas myxillae TaxID=2942214 RepID=UPI00201FB220|nr:hypothetical protein [Muricauda myxillae]MCL6266563.1 hypothetical protein [Muricauda myxillae]